MCKPWRKSLIVKLLGKVLGFQMLITRIKSLWQLEGRYKMVDLGQDNFLFKFESKSDYLHALDGGPWIISGHYLTIRPWFPNFDLLKDEINKIVAWIKFPGFPLEYYNVLALSRMASHVGRVVLLDRNTETAIRSIYKDLCRVRLCQTSDLQVKDW